MEHPRVTWGALNPKPADSSLALFDPALPSRKNVFEGFGLAVRPEARARMHLLSSRTWIKPCIDVRRVEGVEALQYATYWLRKGRLHRDLLRSAWQLLLHPSGATAAGLARLTGRLWSPPYYRFVTILEQEPNPLSYIALDTKRDEFGSRCVKLSWHISPLVRHTLEWVQTTIVSEMTRLGHKCRIFPQVDAEAKIPIKPTYTWVRHHMGTTRMSDDPRTGVVDSDCRVHGVSNLLLPEVRSFRLAGMTCLP